MITETRHCHCCQSINIVRNGHTQQGKQRYKCRDCGVTRVLDPKPAITTEAVESLERSNNERLSYRAIGRIFKVSHVTAFNHLKKSDRITEFQNHDSSGKER
jgi:transposase-like protein